MGEYALAFLAALGGWQIGYRDGRIRSLVATAEAMREAAADLGPREEGPRRLLVGLAEVESGRHVYAHPTCHRCLPPPAPLRRTEVSGG